MIHVYPSYYKDFQCIADRCRHTCCAGWEIDIDEDTVQLYQSLPGAIGGQVRSAMEQAEDGTWHFRLDRSERCPMLTPEGLCTLISSCGEGALCQVCDDHPRFRSFMTGRTEIGLGLCCEAAAALVLSCPDPVQLICEDDGEEDGSPDEAEASILALREALMHRVQDRSMPVHERIARIVQDYELDDGGPLAPLLPFFASLEHMEPAWEQVLLRLGATADEPAPDAAFDTPFEQLMVYLLCRHLTGAAEDGLLRGRLSMCILLWRLIRTLFAAGEQSMEALTELARMTSAELEYSDENLDALLSLFAEDDGECL